MTARSAPESTRASRCGGGLPHVAPLFTFMPEARQALAEVAEFIGEHVAPRAPAATDEGNPAVALASPPMLQAARNAS